MDKTWYDLLKDVLWSEVSKILTPIKQETKDYFNKIVDESKVKQAAEFIKKSYDSTREFTDKQLRSLAEEIDPSILQWEKSDTQNTSVREIESDPVSSVPVTNNISQSVEQQPITISTMVDIVPNPDYRIISWQESINLVTGSSYNLSQMQNESFDAESKQWVSKIQTWMMRIAYNTLNKNKNWLSNDHYAMLSAVWAINFMQLANNKSLWSSTDKLSKNKLFGGKIQSISEQINKSGLWDMLEMATTGTKAFKWSDELLRKYEDAVDLIAQYPQADWITILSSPDMTHDLFHLSSKTTTLGQIQEIISKKRDTVLTLADQVAKLRTNKKIITVLGDTSEKLFGQESAKMKEMSDMVTWVETIINGGIDEFIDGWYADLFPGLSFGGGSLIESLLKFFDNPWIRGIAMSLGIDTRKIAESLTGELSGSQKAQFDRVMKWYTTWWVSDKPTTWTDTFDLKEKTDEYRMIHGLNTPILAQYLCDAQPHDSIVSYIVENYSDKTIQWDLKTRYFAEDKEWNLQRNETVINPQDIKLFATAFTSNENMIGAPLKKKSLLWVSIKDHTEYAAALTGYWIKGNMGMKWGVAALHSQEKTKVSEKSAQLNPEKSTIDNTLNVNGSWAFAKLPNKLNAGNLDASIASMNFSVIDSSNIIPITDQFFDPKHQYPSSMAKVSTYRNHKNSLYWGSKWDISNALKLSMFIPIAEHAGAIVNYNGAINNDPTPWFENKMSYQFATPKWGKGIDVVVAEYRARWIKELNITESLEKNSMLDQYVCWLWYLEQKQDQGKKPFEYLLNLNPTSSIQEYEQWIKNNVQIGGKWFKTHERSQKMMNGRVWDMFEFTQINA